MRDEAAARGKAEADLEEAMTVREGEEESSSSAAMSWSAFLMNKPRSR